MTYLHIYVTTGSPKQVYDLYGDRALIVLNSRAVMATAVST